MRPLRDTSPQKLHLVSIRTDNEFLRMVPSDALNEIIGGVFAYYQEKHSIRLFALSVISNHYHALTDAAGGKLWEFAEDVNRELARRINRFLGRRGHFWGRRYDDVIVITEVDAVTGYLYVLNNCVHHGLVSHVRLWPGISTYWQAMGRKERKYRFTHWAEYSKAKRRAFTTGKVVRLSDYQSEHTLRVSVLPVLEHLTPEQRASTIEMLVEENRKEIHRERLAEGKSEYLGRKVVLGQHHEQRPKNVSRRKRPWFYTRDPEARKHAVEQERLRRKWYEESSIRYRLGDFSAEFPPFCLLPPLHRKPKVEARGYS
jgi:putative transposase